MKFGLSIFEKLLLHEFYPCSDASRVVVSVGFVEAKTYELTVYIHFAVGHLIAFWLVSSHESATAILECIVDLTKSTTESIAITVGITATEETYFFAIEVLLLQSIEKVIPVVLQITSTPSRGTEKEGVVVSYRSSVYFTNIENSFCAECCGDVLSSCFGVTSSAAIENSLHVVIAITKKMYYLCC